METLEQFSQRYPSKLFVKGQTLLLKDEVPQAVHIIESGTVRAYLITPSGNERLVAIHRRGEDLPIGFGFGLTEASQYFYEAYTNCLVRLVPRDIFERYIRSDLTAMYRWHMRAEKLLLATFSRVAALEQPRASEKVAFMLLYMGNQLGVRLRPYKTRFKLTVTQQEIADALGLTRETTGAELKKLEVKQLITHSRKSYVLYMERLRRYLDKRS